MSLERNSKSELGFQADQSDNGSLMATDKAFSTQKVEGRLAAIEDFDANAFKQKLSHISQSFSKHMDKMKEVKEEEPEYFTFQREKAQKSLDSSADTHQLNDIKRKYQVEMKKQESEAMDWRKKLE